MTETGGRGRGRLKRAQPGGRRSPEDMATGPGPSPAAGCGRCGSPLLPLHPFRESTGQDSNCQRVPGRPPAAPALLWGLDGPRCPVSTPRMWKRMSTRTPQRKPRSCSPIAARAGSSRGAPRREGQTPAGLPDAGHCRLRTRSHGRSRRRRGRCHGAACHVCPS